MYFFMGEDLGTEIHLYQAFRTESSLHVLLVDERKMEQIGKLQENPRFNHFQHCLITRILNSMLPSTHTPPGVRLTSPDESAVPEERFHLSRATPGLESGWVA